MSGDETIISDYEVQNAPVFRVTVEDDQTIIRDYATNAPRWKVNGNIGGGGVTTMTTAERMAIIPKKDALIYDSTDGSLYVGDGVTQGGVQASSVGTLPSILALGDWTDELEDVYEVGDWTR